MASEGNTASKKKIENILNKFVLIDFLNLKHSWRIITQKKEHLIEILDGVATKLKDSHCMISVIFTGG